jgi:hypothetical protein
LGETKEGGGPHSKGYLWKRKVLITRVLWKKRGMAALQAARIVHLIRRLYDDEAFDLCRKTLSTM